MFNRTLKLVLTISLTVFIVTSISLAQEHDKKEQNHGNVNGQLMNHKMMDNKSISDSTETGKMSETESIVRNGVIDLQAIDENKDGKVYQCPMNANVLSDTPAKDPKCGMVLEELSLNQAADNLVKRGFQVKDPNSINATTENPLVESQNIAGENNIKTVKVAWNKYCPVSGMKVSPRSETVEYNGKTIGFCCPSANHQKTFLENPEKYMKNLSSDGQKFIGKKS
ncbi:YHS domain protein [bacterium BMS3Abin03]|nr:YHS domain protein [bacterium BMS3Abin03]